MEQISFKRTLQLEAAEAGGGEPLEAGAALGVGGHPSTEQPRASGGLSKRADAGGRGMPASMACVSGSGWEKKGATSMWWNVYVWLL